MLLFMLNLALSFYKKYVLPFNSTGVSKMVQVDESSVETESSTIKPQVRNTQKYSPK